MRALWLLLCASLLAVAQPGPETKAAAVFPSLSPGQPGCAAGVALHGKTVFANAYGTANLEHTAPLTPNTAFYMASVSKQFMAYAILLLAEEGKLSLDDPARKYIPELPAYAGSITIRHLLHHTSGLRDYLMLGMLAGYSPDHVWTDRAARAMIARQKALNFSPGADWNYSNSGYVMLSWIAESVIKQRLNDWSQEKIFRPLGMTNTRWQHNHADPVPNRATGYAGAPGRWRIANSMLDVVGDGGLYSTVEDMLRWNAHFESPGRGAAAALAQMMTPVRNGYGMGLSMGTYRGLKTVSHGGSLAGYRTRFVRYPDHGLGIVLLCNRSDAEVERLTAQLAEVWLGDQMQPPPSAPSAPKPATPKSAPVLESEERGIAGLYWSEELQAQLRVEREGSQLRAGVGDLPASPLRRGSDGHLLLDGVTLRIERNAAGEVSRLLLDAGRVRGIEYKPR